MNWKIHTKENDDMIKLHKKDGDLLYYAESWVEDGIATVHTGTAGTVGECYEEDCANAKNYLKAFKAEYEKNGYRVIPDSEMFWICIKWEVAAPELDEAEEERLTAAYDSLNEAFGWFGLGYADGFEVTEEGGKYFVTLYVLSADKELGIETAKNSIELDKEFKVSAEEFSQA